MTSVFKMPKTREEQFYKLFPDEKPYRWKQIQAALFQSGALAWTDVTALPAAIRNVLEKEIPWMSCKVLHIVESLKKDTYKAIVRLADGCVIETVLMANRRGQWTACVSSQVGCAMKCGFCATGKMGLSRNLTVDEIADQYRVWRKFGRISNIVFMGMGEPMANYENVKNTLRTWLAYTDLGPTHITVSTVGLVPLLQRILKDEEWPRVRIAISLHSADPDTRKHIVPTTSEKFLPTLEEWVRSYFKIRGGRRHHLTFEYVMLRAVNDTPMHAKVLARFAARLGKIKVNLIPYNFTDGQFECSTDDGIVAFKEVLENTGVPVTVRKTMGDDIAAACGQLITVEKQQIS